MRPVFSRRATHVWFVIVFVGLLVRNDMLGVSTWIREPIEVNAPRRQDELPVRPDTAAALQGFFAGKLPTAQAFKVPERTANMLRRDLADAGIAYVDSSGRYADFHSLRHTTGSLLAAEGTHPKVIQSIMRHGDINLTMSRYTHVFRGQESEAVAGLADLALPSSQRQRAVATGTDDKTDLASYLACEDGQPRTATDSVGQANTTVAGAKTAFLMSDAGIEPATC